MLKVRLIPQSCTLSALQPHLPVMSVYRCKHSFCGKYIAYDFWFCNLLSSAFIRYSVYWERYSPRRDGIPSVSFCSTGKHVHVTQSLHLIAVRTTLILGKLKAHEEVRFIVIPGDTLNPTCSIYILFGVVIYVALCIVYGKVYYHVAHYVYTCNQSHQGLYLTSFNFTGTVRRASRGYAVPEYDDIFSKLNNAWVIPKCNHVDVHYRKYVTFKNSSRTTCICHVCTTCNTSSPGVTYVYKC